MSPGDNLPGRKIDAPPAAYPHERMTSKTAPMKINATLPEKGRDLRLDLFRGIANWAIFLDHIPDNVVNWITTRNYGFSDAADLFVFISGYTASFVYARMMMERGFLVGATRLTKRVWQLYVAHIILFVIYIVSIGYLALRFGDSEIINEFNVAGLVDQRRRDAAPGFAAEIQAGQPGRASALHRSDGIFPAGALDDAASAQPDDAGLDRAVACRPAFRLEFSGLSRRAPGTSIRIAGRCCSCSARGARSAEPGSPASMIDAPITLYICIAYLVFALVMTMAGRFPDFGAMFPDWLYATFNPNDKTNLAPYRFLHFVVIVILVIRFLPKDWPGLEWKVFDPADRLRPAIARGVLRRRLPVLCRTFRTDDEFGFAVRADLCQRDRNSDHDRRRLLHLLVEAAGQAAQGGAEAGLGHRVSRALEFLN